MSIWLPIIDDPEITLVRWSIWETGSGQRHFIGFNPAGKEGRVSSYIKEFDMDSMCGVTSSGRIYKLEGPPGYDTNAMYVWNRWKQIKQVSDVKDITQQFVKTG